METLSKVIFSSTCCYYSTDVKLLIPYYFKRTEQVVWKNNCIIQGHIIVSLNEAPNRQAQLATNITLRLRSNKKRCKKINNHLYYVVDSPEFLTVVVIKNKAPAVKPAEIRSMTPLKPKQAKMLKKLFLFTA